MYSYIDLDKESVESLPSEAVFLNGVSLDETLEGFRSMYVEGRESLENELNENIISGVDGSTIQSTRVISRTLTICFRLFADTPSEFESRYRQVAKTLQCGMAKWSFNDEPELYYNGILKKIEQPEKHTTHQTIKAEIYCADPYKYSTTLKRYVPENSAFPIYNAGAIPVPIKYTIEFDKDCGYLALVHGQTQIEIGDRKETDTVATNGSEKLLEMDDFVSADYDRTETSNAYGTYKYPHDMKKVTAKGSQPGAVQKDWLELDTSQGTHEGTWICGSKKVVSIPDDSNDDSDALDWTIYFFNWFECGKMGETGEQTIAVLDTDGNTLGKFVLYKIDTNGNQVVVAFETKAGTVKTFTTSGSFWEPYGGGNRGHGAIEKRDNWIQFYYCGGYYKFFDDELKTRKADKIEITIAENRMNSKPIAINRIANIEFTKHGVQGSVDVPNTFGKGDRLVIDGASGKVWLNDQYRPDLEILGSKFAKANPGINPVKLATSSWYSGTIKATAEIREKWL